MSPQMSLPLTASQKFVDLMKVYKRTAIEFPHLKAITYAQWGLESGWGMSGLAQKYNNFGGAKWRPYMAPYGTSVVYNAHDGRTPYTNFTDLEAWVKGYWARFDLENMYKGWRGHTATPKDFLGYIGPIWLGLGDDAGRVYIRDVTLIHDKWSFAAEFKDKSDEDRSDTPDSGGDVPWGVRLP